jgi:hypothetical protein
MRSQTSEYAMSVENTKKVSCYYPATGFARVAQDSDKNVVTMSEKIIPLGTLRTRYEKVVPFGRCESCNEIEFKLLKTNDKWLCCECAYSV